MRTSEGRMAGSGVTLAFKEETEIWKDKKVKYVLFPKHENIYPKNLREYHIDNLDTDTKIRLGLM